MDTNKTATRRAKRWISFALAGLMVVGAFAGGAAAHVSDDHGELTFHDSENGEPQTSTATEPDPVELTCEFWVKGHNLSHQSGWINATSGSGPSVEVTTVGTFNGTENEDGTYDFEAGPFTLEQTDTYRISADGAQQLREVRDGHTGPDRLGGSGRRGAERRHRHQQRRAEEDAASGDPSDFSWHRLAPFSWSGQ